MTIQNARSRGISMKRPYTDTQLLNHLSTKLTFNDAERLHAPIFFRENTYYRFSVFPKLLPSSPSTTYSFTDSVNLYKFDEFLREELSIFLDYIEKRVKSTLIHYFCNNYRDPSHYTAQCYIDTNIYRNVHNRDRAVKTIEDCISKSNTPAMQHHKNTPNHGDCYVPIWLAFDELTFGGLNTVVKALKDTHLKKWAKEYFAPNAANGQNYAANVIKSWLECLRFIRNTIAHHGRLYGTHIPFQPRIINADSTLFSNITTQKNRLYGALYVIKKFLIQDTNGRIVYKWNNFLKMLQEQIDTNITILECDTRLGFDDNWHQNLSIISY